MLRLLLETATDVCSVAIEKDGKVVAEHTAAEGYKHSSHLTVFIAEVAERAGVRLGELDAVVLSDGPGSYTSLRVGAATAKGLCLALPGLRLEAVPSLTALAYAADNPEGLPILATINSRRGEVYGQLFAADLVELSEPSNVRLTEPDWKDKLGVPGKLVVCGPGQERLADHTQTDDGITRVDPKHPTARFLSLPAARPGNAAEYEPFYLNPPFVTTPRKRNLL